MMGKELKVQIANYRWVRKIGDSVNFTKSGAAANLLPGYEPLVKKLE